MVLPDGNTREDLHNSKVDAYRHAYTSGTIAMQYGSLNSNFLGQFYEIWGDLAHKQDSKEKGMDIWNLGGSVGGHDKEGLTKATIGLGDVTIVGLSEVPDGVNRDVSSVQEMETNYDVQTIKPYFTNQDIETLIDGLIREALTWAQP